MGSSRGCRPSTTKGNTAKASDHFWLWSMYGGGKIERLEITAKRMTAILIPFMRGGGDIILE